MNDKRPSRALVESPSTWGEYGYWNRWGGFHRTTDAFAYWTFLREFVKHPSLLWARGMSRMARDRWRHRRCDTTDFHHYACTLDPFGKRLDDNYRWQRTWAGHADKGSSDE